MLTCGKKTLLCLLGFVILIAILTMFVLNKKRILISVVMPVYNTEKYLEQNIQSVLSQTLKNFEFIIVDDGSTDNSLKIIKKYADNDSRIKLFTLPKNSGAAVARNEGLKHVSGKYTLFIDSDDWINETTLENVYNHAEKLQLDIVMFLAIEFNEKSQKYVDGYSIDKKIAFSYEILEERKLQVFSYKDIPDKFFNFSKHYPWNKLIKTSLIKEHNLYFDNIPHHNDSFFITMAMVYAKRIGYIKERLYFYRKHRRGAISNDSSKDARSIWLTFKKVKHELLVSGLYPELSVSFKSWANNWFKPILKAAKIAPDQIIYYDKLNELIQEDALLD